MKTTKYDITTDMVETYDEDTYPFCNYMQLANALNKIRRLPEKDFEGVKSAVLGYISNLHEMLGKGKLK